MTRDEAAHILHKIKQDMLIGAIRKFKAFNDEELLNDEVYDAINIAIEALEKNENGGR